MRETAAEYSCPLFLFVCLVLIVNESGRLRCSSLRSLHCTSTYLPDPVHLRKQARGFLVPEEGEL